MPRVIGAVLAGGASSRFGSDKALARVGGETLLDLTQAMLTPWVDTVVVVGRDGGVPDRPQPGLGPLGGIAGALVWARARGFASVLTIGCDMPAVPAALLQALRQGLPAYCADAPVLGHWPTSAADALLTLLSGAVAPAPTLRPPAGIEGAAHAPAAATGTPMPQKGSPKNATLSVRRWAQAIGATAVPAPCPLRNVNTPADLAHR